MPSQSIMPTLDVLQGCATIALTQGGNTLIDAKDLPLLAQWRWYVAKGRKGGPRAARGIRRGRKTRILLLHRWLMSPPVGLEVDHKNCDTLDNRRENLRIVTRGQNATNVLKYRRNGAASSRFKGVHWKEQTQRWGASIRHHRHLFHLGYFASEADAALAYNRAAVELFGEFARINEGV